MTKIDYSGKTVSIGIDVHKRQYTICCVSEGIKLRQATTPPSPEEVVKFAAKYFPGAMIRTAYEAGFSGYGLHRHLENAGIPNLVVNAASIAVSRKDKVKTDRRDSLKLATQLDAKRGGTDELMGIRVPSVQQEAARLLPRTRKQIVWCRTRHKNRLRMRLYQFGFTLGATITLSQVTEFLANHLTLPMELISSIESYVRLWEGLQQ